MSDIIREIIEEIKDAGIGIDISHIETGEASHSYVFSNENHEVILRFKEDGTIILRDKIIAVDKEATGLIFHFIRTIFTNARSDLPMDTAPTTD